MGLGPVIIYYETEEKLRELHDELDEGRWMPWSTVDFPMKSKLGGDVQFIQFDCSLGFTCSYCNNTFCVGCSGRYDDTFDYVCIVDIEHDQVCCGGCSYKIYPYNIDTWNVLLRTALPWNESIRDEFRRGIKYEKKYGPSNSPCIQ